MNAREIPWRRWMPVFVVGFVVLLVVVLVLPAIQMGRENARRSSSKNNLKQLGISFHNYLDVYRSFPSGGVFGKDGTAYHGWGPALWPYIEAQHYSSMIDEYAPWDAPHNSFLFKHDPGVFASPNIPLKSSAEGFTPSHYIANENIFHRNSSYSFKDIMGGLAHNWLLTDQFQDWWPWGSPYNWGPLEWPRPGAHGENGWSGGVAMLLMADGSVEMFSPESDPSIMRTYRDAPLLPEPEAIEKPSNDYRFNSPPWEQRVLKLREKSEDTYCIVLTTPSEEFDTAYVQFDNGNMGVELVTDDVKYLLETFPEITTMRLEMWLDDELLDVLLRNKKLKNLVVGYITLSSDGIERLKEFPMLEFLYGGADEEVRDEIQQVLPGLKLNHR